MVSKESPGEYDIAGLVLTAGLAATTPIEIAQKAFDLRLAGKVDEAVGLLEEAVAGDSTQAILFYELSRAKLFLMDFEGMQDAIEKAVALEPANADYHYFAGLASSFSLINAAHHDQQDQMKHFGDKTISELEAAVRCNPDHLEARCTLVQRITALAEDMGWDTKAAEEHARILVAGLVRSRRWLPRRRQSRAGVRVPRQGT